jgi:hypothetical protein
MAHFNAMRMQWSAAVSPVHHLAPFGFRFLQARLGNGIVETSLFVHGGDVDGAAVSGNRMSTTDTSRTRFACQDNRLQRSAIHRNDPRRANPGMGTFLQGPSYLDGVIEES